MDLFPLTLFPEGGLASSIITTVWVGVFVLCFFNLRFGWVLSGLVVPGYLVPLLIVKPVAAVVVVAEAVITYGLVWLFSEKLAAGRYPALFGRDRFMALVLASIAVRLVMDGLAMPALAGWLEENFDRQLDWRDNLQSFGLVIISLMANQFWKPGLARGLAACVVTIGITWFIVRFGLMEFTNFRISGVSYMYEGIASSILASPKAYIILTLTALLASRMNVRYGWDFSGILIPALIALQWYQPGKIVTSFLEAIVIYVVARLVLKLPVMANVTLEGGRKLLLFFNISFAWKLALGWFIVWQELNVKTTDFYGFGYLLSTLIAIKAHDKDIFPRLARSTLQVSLAGAVLGNIVGFSLSAASSRMLGPAEGEATRDGGAGQGRLAALAIAAIGDAHIRARRGEARPLGEREAHMLGQLVELAEAGLPEMAPELALAADGWRVQALADGRLAIARDDGLGRELLLFDPAARHKLAIVLADPTAAPGLGSAALALQRAQQASWLVIAAPTPPAQLGGRDVLGVFESATTHAQLRLAAAGEGEASRARFANRAATALDLATLRRAVPGLEVGFDAASGLSGDSGLIALDSAAIARLARAGAGGTGQGMARADRLPACRLPRAAQPQAGWHEAEQLAFMRWEIAAPLVASVRAGEMPHRSQAASELAGFVLAPCRIGARIHWSLAAPAREEGHVFLAQGEAPQRAVLSYRLGQVTWPARIGAAIHDQWQADALFILPQSDNLLRDPGSAIDVVWQEWVRQQEGVEDGFTLQLRGRRSVPQEGFAARDIVLVQDRIGPLHPEVDELMSVIRQAGLRPALADGSREFAGFEARPTMAMRYFDQTSGRRHAFGWLLPPRGRGAP